LLPKDNKLVDELNPKLIQGLLSFIDTDAFKDETNLDKVMRAIAVDPILKARYSVITDTPYEAVEEIELVDDPDKTEPIETYKYPDTFYNNSPLGDPFTNKVAGAVVRINKDNINEIDTYIYDNNVVDAKVVIAAKHLSNHIKADTVSALIDVIENKPQKLLLMSGFLDGSFGPLF
jgi:hypothetical protein